MLFYCKYVAKWYNWTVVSKFRESVEKYTHNVMLVNCASGEEWTYTQVILTSLGEFIVVDIRFHISM